MRTDTRILVVESNPVFRGGLRSLLSAADGLRVVDTAPDAEAAASLIMRELPDLLLLGVEDPDADVGTQLDRIFAARADQQVLLLGRYPREDAADLLMRPGVRGQLPRQVTDDHLVSVIREIGQNDEWIFVSAPRTALPALLTTDCAVLSPREQEVVRLMARSMTNRQIAGTLHLSDGTVKRHIHNIVTKLGAESRMDAVRRSVIYATSFESQQQVNERD
ncbi:response regulator transcription factor [Streptomyces sp. MN03-5084-2B]|nr:response regulator transcription factor [Streptomyces sp. MN03-5084-2B]